jgi:hypothetical protein
MRNRVLAVAAAALLPFAAASAQANAVPHNVISIQPLNAMFTVYSAEYERQTGKSVTFGVGGTYWSAGDEDVNEDVSYTSGDVKLRFYPSGAALTGFSFGGSVGFTSVSGNNSSGVEESASGPTFGVLLEYQWLMGVKKNFSVALGAGAKKIFASDEDISSDSFNPAYPTARVSVGYAW